MKKLLALCLLMLSIQSLHAQEDNARTFRGGIRISPFMSWLKTDLDNPEFNTIENNATPIGFSYGVMLDKYLNDNYLLGFELRIAHMKNSFKFTTVAQSYTFETVREARTQSVELPVTLKMRTNEIGYFRYFGQFGIMPAVVISSKGDITNTTTRPGSKVTEELTDRKINSDINTFLAYLVIGAGTEYNLGGNTSVIASLTWNNGFLNLWDKDVLKEQAASEKIYTRPAYVALNLGIMF